jgi:hypothetical protein
VKYTETREGIEGEIPKKKDYVSQGGVPVTRGRPSAARLLLLCAVSSNASNIHARPRVDLSTKEPHRREQSRSPPSLLFTFAAHFYLHDNCFCASTHVSQYCASACRSFICRRSAATLHYALLRLTVLSRAIFATLSPSHTTSSKLPDRIHPPFNSHH